MGKVIENVVLNDGNTNVQKLYFRGTRAWGSTLKGQPHIFSTPQVLVP